MTADAGVERQTGLVRAEAAHGAELHPPHPVAGGTDTTILGVLLFIASESMFFAGLFAAYFNTKVKYPTWPPQGIELDTVLAAVLTVALVTSSFTMQIAIWRIRKGDRRGMMRALTVTLILGVLFLCGQLYDYATLNFSFTSGVYGALFFTMTGFHGAHVAGGVVAISAMLLRGSAGQFSAKHHAALEGVSAYWHFVDVIWLLQFSTLYLLR